MTEERVLGNSMYNHWRRFMRNSAILILVAAALVSLLHSAVFGSMGLIFFLVILAVIPLIIILPPYLPKTVTLAEDRLHLNYQRPLKDVTVRWTRVSVMKAWRRRRALSIPEFCTLEFFDENGNKVRPPLLLHVSTSIVDEIERFLEESNHRVAVKREKAPWWIGGWGWGDD